ncbi:MAG: T9SS type A sorting domain-containing protein [Bacteroidetes bacterium]|nr:MAG: T9SS type A sorting domain-containing protein [Bacteroidota bacterium]
MKKIYTLGIALSLTLSSFVQAQSLSLVTMDTNTVANSSYLHEVKAHVTVTNNGPEATFEMARIYNGSVGIADSNYFCWDLCYGVGTDSSQFGGVTLANGARNSDFYIGWYIKGNNVTESDSVIYRYYNAADVNDYLDIVFHLSVAPSISIRESKAVTVNAYPNPAKDRLTVQVGNMDHGVVRLMNLAGMVVSQKNFTSNSTPVEMEVRTLPAGVYMLQVVNDGQILNTQRIVVSH